MTDFSPEARARAIWSTEAAAACGVSDKTTPAQLWARKNGAVVDDMGDMPLPARLGLACQDGVARIHAEDTGHELRPLGDTEHLVEPAGFPMGSHYDYLNTTTRMLHEVKFFAIHRLKEFGEPGSDNVPMDVLCQCLHEMACWNATMTAPAARVNGVEVDVVFGNVNRFVFVVPWDLAAIDTLYKREAEFWSLVQTGTPPEPKTIEDMRLAFAKTDGSVIEATPDALATHQALKTVRAQIDALEGQEEALKAWLMKFMGAAEGLESQGKRLASWGAVKGRETIDSKLLRAQYPEIAAAVTKVGEAGRRFTIK